MWKITNSQMGSRKIGPLLKLLSCKNQVNARLFALKKFFQLFACSNYRYNSLPCGVSIICILETKADNGNNVSRRANQQKLGKHAHAMNISGKMLPRFVDACLRSQNFCNCSLAQIFVKLPCQHILHIGNKTLHWKQCFPQGKLREIWETQRTP